MAGLARQRLTEERKNFRKEKPFGFSAKPRKNADGSMNMLFWECIIPGKEGTDWAGGFYPLTLEFSEDYPSKPPKDEGWRPSITVKQVLTGIQDLLDTPNDLSPAQADAYLFHTKKPDEYRRRVKKQAQDYQVQ